MSSATMHTFEAKLVELGCEVRDQSMVLAEQSQALNALQKVTDHLVNNGSVRRHFLQI